MRDAKLTRLNASQAFTRPILEQALEKKKAREKSGELGVDGRDVEEEEGESLLDVLIFKSEDLKFGSSACSRFFLPSRPSLITAAFFL